MTPRAIRHQRSFCKPLQYNDLDNADDWHPHCSCGSPQRRGGRACVVDEAQGQTFKLTGGGLPMRLPRKQNDEREPIGIVIADGRNGDKAPRVSAFVWGPVPDDTLLPTDAPLELVAT
jgi:hypothetical protein